MLPEFKTLSDMLRSRAEDRLRGSMDMSGIEATGIQGINDAYGGAEMALENSLTSRGLGTSPVAGAANLNLGRRRAWRLRVRATRVHGTLNEGVDGRGAAP